MAFLSVGLGLKSGVRTILCEEYYIPFTGDMGERQKYLIGVHYRFLYRKYRFLVYHTEREVSALT